MRRLIIFPYVLDMAVPLFLLISAYLRTAKIQRQGLRDSYSLNEIVKSFVSTVTAYTMIVLVQYAVSILRHRYFGFDLLFIPGSYRSFLWWIVSGASGPGSYYVPILLQLILYFSLIYLLFRRSKNVGLVCTLLINTVYELLVAGLALSPVLYRLLIFDTLLFWVWGSISSSRKSTSNVMI